MDNFTLFVCGVVVTFVAGMGVITSEVEEQEDGTIKQIV